MLTGLEGRPLTRDEERRIGTQITDRQPGSRWLGTPKGWPLTRDEKCRIATQITEGQPGSRWLGIALRYAISNPTAEFTALFVLGMLGGISAVFIALFIL
jgi:hypothetical protein